MKKVQSLPNFCRMVFIRRLSTQGFNAFCLGLALGWLVITIPIGILWRPTVPDFSQFYIGGLLASRGEWSSLYPVPRPGSRDNPGLSLDSFPKSGWRALSEWYGIPDTTRFILPPPSALLFIPLSWMSYEQAFWVWTCLLIASVWGVAFISGRLFRKLAGLPTRIEGILALMIVLSPMTARAIRIANVSPFIALLLGITLWVLTSPRRPLLGATALLGGALLKYATLILTPLLIVTRRWGTLFWLVALTIALLAATLWIAGPRPFTEFFQVILPTLSRPSRYPGNQSLAGMLARIYGRPLNSTVSLFLNGARVMTLEAILILFLLARPQSWQNPSQIFSSAGLLISWLLIFSPIAWEHWPIFLCPIWGWLLWEACIPGLKRVLALTSLALLNLPAGIIQVPGFLKYPIILPEPFNSWQLLGFILVWALTFWSLLEQVTFSSFKQTI